MENDRIEAFKRDVEAMQARARTGRAQLESRLQALGALLMVGGIVLGVVGYSASLNTDISVKGQLDSSSYLTLAVIGVAVTIAGTGMFVRYSLARFLRVWLLRQSYENQANIERLVERSIPADGRSSADA